MQSAEGEAEKQALRERIDQLMRSQQELESRSTSLQLTVDRLTLALAKTEEEEQAFKEKVIIVQEFNEYFLVRTYRSSNCLATDSALVVSLITDFLESSHNNNKLHFH